MASAGALRMQALTALLLPLFPPLANSSFSPRPTGKWMAAETASSGSATKYPSAFLVSAHQRRDGNKERAPTSTVVATLFAQDDVATASACYVPPYGTVPRSSGVMRMRDQSDDSYDGVDEDDRFREKTNARRATDPVAQDFGSARDGPASATGRGRRGDERPGDARASARSGPGKAAVPMMVRERDAADGIFEGDGGNFWVNTPGATDRYPVPRRRPGGRRRRPEGDGRVRRRSAEDDDDARWATTQRDREDARSDWEDEDGYGEYEYGVPPPNRSRSSFRSGAPPPPNPVKNLYDRLFWFGFDSDATQPADRTMFGGTRGKFNAMALLKDREDRQRRRERPDGGGRGGSAFYPPDAAPPRMSPYDVGREYRDEYAAEAAYIADDYEPRLQEDDFYLSNEDFEREQWGGLERPGRQRGRARGTQRRQRETDRRAVEYDRILAGGGGGGGGDYLDPPIENYLELGDDDYLNIPNGEYLEPNDMAPEPQYAPSRRRRKGFAYKYDATDLFDSDDGEYIDVEARYPVDDPPAPPSPNNSNSDQARERRRRRSWEERALEMDRVPPQNAMAWGPDGPIKGENPLGRAAKKAIEKIEKAERALERKEERVDRAKEEVIGLKNDASDCANEQELGYLRQDIENASRDLRLARAEKDAAADRVIELKEQHWALLSEYEATLSFTEEVLN